MYYTQRASHTCQYFFFFQAEDGIRDLTVTGVQTCALPISHVVRGVLARLDGEEVLGVADVRAQIRGHRVERLEEPGECAGVGSHDRVRRVGEIGRAACRERV